MIQQVANVLIKLSKKMRDGRYRIFQQCLCPARPRLLAHMPPQDSSVSQPGHPCLSSELQLQRHPSGWLPEAQTVCLPVTSLGTLPPLTLGSWLVPVILPAGLWPPGVGCLTCCSISVTRCGTGTR